MSERSFRATDEQPARGLGGATGRGFNPGRSARNFGDAVRHLTVAIALCLIHIPQAAAQAPVQARHGMVATSEFRASEVGVDILKQGGNSVDAAVAIGYTLAVVHPCCGNLGGGGFATIHLANGETTVISFREKAPAAATPGQSGEGVGDKSINC